MNNMVIKGRGNVSLQIELPMEVYYSIVGKKGKRPNRNQRSNTIFSFH